MAIRNILLHLTQDARSAARRQAAIAVARAHEATLTALYVVPAPRLPRYLQRHVPDHILDELRARAVAAAEEPEAAFIEAAEAAGIGHEWRVVEEAVGGQTDLHARYADLVVVGQVHPDAESGSVYDLAEELGLLAGRPVLAIP